MEYVDEVLAESRHPNEHIEWIDDNEEMVDFEDDDTQFDDAINSSNPLQEL